MGVAKVLCAAGTRRLYPDPVLARYLLRRATSVQEAAREAGVHINARAILNVIANILTEMNIAADCVALFRIEAGEIAATIAIRRILLRALRRAFCMARMRSSTPRTLR